AIERGTGRTHRSAPTKTAVVPKLLERENSSSRPDTNQSGSTTVRLRSRCRFSVRRACGIVPTLARRALRKIILEHNKNFPFVAVRIPHPGFVLRRVTT